MTTPKQDLTAEQIENFRSYCHAYLEKIGPTHTLIDRVCGLALKGSEAQKPEPSGGCPVCGEPYEQGRHMRLRDEQLCAGPSPTPGDKDVEREDCAEKILEIGRKNKWALTEEDEDTIGEWFTGSKSVPPSWWKRAEDNLREAFVENDIPLGPLAPQEMQPLDVGQNCEAYIATIPYPPSPSGSVEGLGDLDTLNQWWDEADSGQHAGDAAPYLAYGLNITPSVEGLIARLIEEAAFVEGQTNFVGTARTILEAAEALRRLSKGQA